MFNNSINVCSSLLIDNKNLMFYFDLSYAKDGGLAFPLLIRSRRMQSDLDRIATYYNEQGEIKGWSAIYDSPTFRFKGYPVLMIYVDPRERLKGIGTKLVESLLKDTKIIGPIGVVTRSSDIDETQRRVKLFAKWPSRLYDVTKLN